MSYTVEYPDMGAAGKMNRLPTVELPTETVSRKVAVWIFESGAVDPAQPRVGAFRLWYSIGDEPNGSLAPDEAKYILRLLEHAARSWRQAHEILP